MNAPSAKFYLVVETNNASREDLTNSAQHSQQDLNTKGESAEKHL